MQYLTTRKMCCFIWY